MSDSSTIENAFSVHIQDKIAVLQLNRLPVNALNYASYERLNSLVDELAVRDDVNCLVLRSRSHVFSAGADLKEVSTSTPEFDEQKQVAARTLFQKIRLFPVPVIAAVNGPALGAGAGLAAAADIRYASEGATFGLPEINVGRAGGGRHLMRHLPQGKVRELYFTGQPMSAMDAFQFGFVNVVVPGDAESLNEAVMALASTIAEKGHTTLRLAKESLNACEEMPIDLGYHLEQQYSLRLGLMRALES